MDDGGGGKFYFCGAIHERWITKGSVDIIPKITLKNNGIKSNYNSIKLLFSIQLFTKMDMCKYVQYVYTPAIEHQTPNHWQWWYNWIADSVCTPWYL